MMSWVKEALLMAAWCALAAVTVVTLSVVAICDDGSGGASAAAEARVVTVPELRVHCASLTVHGLSCVVCRAADGLDVRGDVSVSCK